MIDRPSIPHVIIKTLISDKCLLKQLDDMLKWSYIWLYYHSEQKPCADRGMPGEIQAVACSPIDNREQRTGAGGGWVSGEEENRRDEEHEVWRDRAEERIRGGGGVEIQAEQLWSQHPGSLWVLTGCGPLRVDCSRFRTLAQITRLDAVTAQRKPAGTEGHN